MTKSDDFLDRDTNNDTFIGGIDVFYRRRRRRSFANGSATTYYSPLIIITIGNGSDLEDMVVRDYIKALDQAVCVFTGFTIIDFSTL